ncbi:MAG: hypothetical protein A3C93_00350 [Candidatus Lloydbacteria bacterium RIFCSPHIGHO2_02_FULL_54_17]|uniref:Aldehyde dehydrogenase domain-containing protein n=1 Tax=Candidatus Lloydbacteria bacterium RIFCSPHIGHO2_02_FULL_54_17 TaxID=1798664 RepID=A0A1G2DDY4_9BACT|nr:MAG: hypothetical protein A2762_01950 [Candidatus Lloydbacteria bacterium RIFCSPHIGHO2_01_FULL_54_11]OGZ11839.1 MAG: hypothetical protein A3C93_00350 [Candidatus Lloydbacteria bacterium RIFCSPHIGHO2_02_FULL_54_17]OGZ14139.1 MAG: hypothetical protein A2948_03435 [Candidatus Lloydbacteria bacterium RIFCSPLOWO2_01_FULL_54_18]OGZ16684.1 MAG: hypothetical protein A3H76_00055 [Candidatus Lloydbacteria bacterium RIFCSPLOWO2_02_FULL_54_12]
MFPSEQVVLAELNRITQGESIPDFSKSEIAAKVADGFARFAHWTGKPWPHELGGMQLTNGKTFVSDNPYTGEPIGYFFGTPDKAVLDEAMRRVVLAQKRWEKLGWKKRLSVLYRLAQMLQEERWVYLFVASLVSEIGMSYPEAYGEYNEVYRFILQTVYFAMKEYRQDGIPSAAFSGNTQAVYLKPYGVGLVACPFNFPVATSTNMVVYMLAFGNAVLIKGSDKAALTTRILYDAFSQALADEGVENNGIINFVPGPGGDMVRALLAHPDVKLFSLTGSPAAFESVMKEFGSIPRNGVNQLSVGCAETGGVNVMLVCDDADPKEVALAARMGSAGRSGEKCSSTRIVLAPELLVPDILENLVKEFEGVSYGDVKKGAYMGPLISREAKGRISSGIRELVEKGVVALVYEKKIAPSPSGYDLPPTILIAHPDAYEHRDSKRFETIFNTEFFATVVTIVPYRSREDAERMIATSRYGLTGAVFSNVPESLAWGLLTIPSGMRYINRKQTGATSAEGFHGAGGTASSYNGGMTGQHLCVRHYTPIHLSGFVRNWSSDEFERFVLALGDNVAFVKHPAV